MEIKALVGERFAQCFTYSRMNAVQERVLPAAFLRRENLVVASPTASGKTTVFEAAFLRHWNVSKDSKRSSHEGKVLYLAPIKALLHERQAIINSWRGITLSRLLDWKKRFDSLGIGFVELSDNNQDIRPATVILSTPERVWIPLHLNIQLGWRLHFNEPFV